jgi:hypothetical protein
MLRAFGCSGICRKKGEVGFVGVQILFLLDFRSLLEWIDGVLNQGNHFC